MSYQSNWANVKARMEAARDAGLVAAAYVGITNTKRRLVPDYYTGGQWATGQTLNSITRTEPFDGPDGRAIQYGTALKRALYWEVGFNQRLHVWYDEKKGRWFSKPGPTRFVRKEIWAPVFLESQEELLAAYTRVFERMMAS